MFQYGHGPQGIGWYDVGGDPPAPAPPMPAGWGQPVQPVPYPPIPEVHYDLPPPPPRPAPPLAPQTWGASGWSAVGQHPDPLDDAATALRDMLLRGHAVYANQQTGTVDVYVRDDQGAASMRGYLLPQVGRRVRAGRGPGTGFPIVLVQPYDHEFGSRTPL